VASPDPAHQERDLAVEGQDPSRTYTAEEDRRIALNLLALKQRIYDGLERPALTLASLLSIHRTIFFGIRYHAGRHRASDFGSEHLIFGPNRSTHRTEVAAELDRVFLVIDRASRSLSDRRTHDDYEQFVIQFAAWLQASIVKIHPFEDGNGRSTRLFTDVFLIRHGLRPIPIEVVKDEYNAALNEFNRSGDVRLLMDLMLRIYPLE
jgi:fido (protein-threonine AMPylation protein)